MRYFPLMDFQHWVLALFLGLLGLILVYVAWMGYGGRRKGWEQPQGAQESEAGGHDEAEKNAIPPFLVLVFLGAALWALGYMIFVGIRGVAF